MVEAKEKKNPGLFGNKVRMRRRMVCLLVRLRAGRWLGRSGRVCGAEGRVGTMVWSLGLLEYVECCSGRYLDGRIGYEEA
jgi:hypothetical protein